MRLSDFGRQQHAPEPSSLILLTLGGPAAIRRRQMRRVARVTGPDAAHKKMMLYLSGLIAINLRLNSALANLLIALCRGQPGDACGVCTVVRDRANARESPLTPKRIANALSTH